MNQTNIQDINDLARTRLTQIFRYVQAFDHLQNPPQQEIEKQPWVQGVMRGVSLAVVGLLLTVCWSIISRSGQDWKSWLIGTAAFGLAFSRRVNLLVILGLAAIAGYLLYGLS